MPASMGRIVHYTLTEQDAQAINQRRADFADHRGNTAREGDAYPAVIVRTWESSQNLKVLLDGTDDFWATSRTQGDGPGRWIWPPRVES